MRKSRSGGRSGNKRRENSFSISQTPWSLPINNDNFIEPIPLEGIEKIHKTAMRILEDIGIEFINSENSENAVLDAKKQISVYI